MTIGRSDGPPNGPGAKTIWRSVECGGQFRPAVGVGAEPISTCWTPSRTVTFRTPPKGSPASRFEPALRNGSSANSRSSAHWRGTPRALDREVDVRGDAPLRVRRRTDRAEREPPLGIGPGPAAEAPSLNAACVVHAGAVRLVGEDDDVRQWLLPRFVEDAALNDEGGAGLALRRDASAGADLRRPRALRGGPRAHPVRVLREGSGSEEEKDRVAHRAPRFHGFEELMMDPFASDLRQGSVTVRIRRSGDLVIDD